jgi:methylenetetrahydrofolate reductase (NADPH)
MAIVKAKDADAIKQIGIEWCIAQSKELVAAGIPVLHYYSMGRAANIRQIAQAVF